MTSDTLTVFEQLADVQDAAAATERLIQYFRAHRRPFELFEAIKMRTRIKLGLPPVSLETEESSNEATDHALEAGLLGSMSRSRHHVDGRRTSP
jgi:hypothetical protein